MSRMGRMAIIGLLVAVNAVVLAGVAWNRSGQPEALLELTEREVPFFPAYGQRENSGVALVLNVNNDTEAQTWFDADTLAELGFAMDATRSGYRALSRKAYAVLAYGGEAWAAYEKRQRQEIAALDDKVKEGKLKAEAADRRRQQMRFELGVASRLFPIDVGGDREALRRRYPDRATYIILPVLVRMFDRKGDGEGQREFYGRIERVIVDSLHVPRRLQGPLRSLEDGSRIRPGYTYFNAKDPARVRYTARVAFGRRLEPWVQEIRLTALEPADE